MKTQLKRFACANLALLILAVTSNLISQANAEEPGQADKPPRAAAAQAGKEIDPWASAEAAFAEHTAPLLKKLREHYPKAQYVHFKSDLLNKYLPNHRVYGLESEGYFISIPNVLILDQKGMIAPLSDPDGRSEQSWIKGITDILTTQEIKIDNETIATDLSKLIEQLRSAPHSSHGDAGKNWKHSATKTNDGWHVKIHFTGPIGVSIIVPPDYKFNVNDKQILTSIQMIPWRS